MCRYKTSLSPRQSETAIIATAHHWKAHYEWVAHAEQALKAGVKPETVKAIQAGREPKSAQKDEKAIIDFVKELYKTQRVSDKTYKRLHGLFGDAGMVELVGICGYYALISMTLNVFRARNPGRHAAAVQGAVGTHREHSMSSARRRLQRIAVEAGTALALLVLLSAIDSAIAQRRAAQTSGAPACFDTCAAQCRSTGGNAATCSRTCYGQCSGISGNIENRH